jgi:hypothetical protein
MIVSRMPDCIQSPRGPARSVSNSEMIQTLANKEPDSVSGYQRCQPILSLPKKSRGFSVRSGRN